MRRHRTPAAAVAVAAALAVAPALAPGAPAGPAPGAPAGHAAGPGPQTVDYSYDALGRLTAAVYDSAWVVEYSYDENGNLLTRESRAYTVDIGPGPGSKLRFWLGPALPNPARGSARIRFSLARDAAVRVTLYDLSGQRVRRLVRDERAAGEHVVEWDGRDDAGRRLASGLYFFEFEGGGFRATGRMVLLQ